MSIRRPQPRIGVYDQPYWDYALKGELRVQACKHCGHLRYPPGPSCPKCLSEETEWQELSGRGTIVAWTVFQRSYFPDIPLPYTVVSVETEEGPLLIGNLVDAGGVKPSVGVPVTVVFEDVMFGSEPGRLCQWTPANKRTTEFQGGTP